MPSVKRMESGRWRARYRRDGKQYEKHFRREIDATRWVREMTASDVTGAFVDPSRGRVTISSIADVWLQTPSWTESTRARNRSIVGTYIIPRWGSVRVDRVAYETVQAWVNELSLTLAPTTVHKVAGVLRSILRVAVKSRRIAVNPANDLELPRPKVKARRYLDAYQVESLAEAADEHSLLVYVLAYTGLRFGELAGLQVANVDLMRRRFRVERSVTEVNGALVYSSPKDHQRRSVPYPAFLDEEIRALVSGRPLEAPLFTSPLGGVLRSRNVRRDWFDLAAKIAGVEGLTPHELRHTAASMAISAGATPLGVQRMLGHEKASVTLDVYSDLFDSDLDDVSNRMDALRSKASEGKMRAI